jgi:hypothetical protein
MPPLPHRNAQASTTRCTVSLSPDTRCSESVVPDCRADRRTDRCADHNVRCGRSKADGRFHSGNPVPRRTPYVAARVTSMSVHGWTRFQTVAGLQPKTLACATQAARLTRRSSRHLATALASHLECSCHGMLWAARAAWAGLVFGFAWASSELQAARPDKHSSAIPAF